MPSHTTPEATPSVTWRTRAVRRGAATLGAAVVLAGVAPAIANAAGADVANPVAVALRASGKSLVTAFSATGDDAAAGACVTPTADATETASATPEPTATVEPTAEVSAEPTETASPNPDAAVSADPSATPTEAATTTPAECPEATETTSPEPTETPAETPAEETAAEENHGQIVSTVAKCAPKGKDPLLDVEGAPRNHGGYVRVAAHGETLTLPWGTFDLSTQAGADALCASLDAARAELPEDSAAAKADKGKKGAAKADKAKPAKAKAGKGAGRPTHAGGKGGGKGGKR